MQIFQTYHTDFRKNNLKDQKLSLEVTESTENDELRIAQDNHIEQKCQISVEIMKNLIQQAWCTVFILHRLSFAIRRSIEANKSNDWNRAQISFNRHEKFKEIVTMFIHIAISSH